MRDGSEIPIDRWVGVVLLVVAAGLFYDTFFFRTFNWDPVGMTFWPRVLLAAMAAIAIWHIVKGRVAAGAAERFTLRSFVVFGGGVVYVFLLDYLGFFIITPVALFIYSLWLRPMSARAVVSSVVVAVSGTGLVYAIFEYGMDVILPRGILG
ncbi:tripartite tricarboxylate transporter TctB family protein [Shumkonia mesophila]|uniref:tripartite tricarboxylate transporter TctB family protein n=1 Tax=Shumkonia mesophila TaxID=2838854 RepID=UPI002934ED4A|nr:tripartite tricarboxylate transporter TctB family protein [Shumkonia mesophila]